jgi:hypothetical protein
MNEKLVCPACKKEFDDGRGAHRHIEYCNGGINTGAYIERYKSIRKHIPEQYHAIYDKLTGGGHTPRGVFAAIHYIESTETLEEVSGLCDTSIPTIRDKIHKLVNADVVENT